MCVCDVILFCLFVFKQKTAYEMRISDLSSDVCSSDLPKRLGPLGSRTDRCIILCGHENRADAEPVVDLLGGLHAIRPMRQMNIHQDRSEERRVGNECVSTCRYRWSSYQ